MIPMKLEFYGYSISRTMLACSGMGATMGMLVGGTTFGVPTAIAAAIIGAIGGGVLGHFIEWKDEHSDLPSKRRRGSGEARHYVAGSISERTLHVENSDLGNQAGQRDESRAIVTHSSLVARQTNWRRIPLFYEM